MSNLGDGNLQNFESLIDNYESTIREITSELDTFQIEHTAIKKEIVVLLEENKRLSSQLSVCLGERSSSDIIDYRHEDAEVVDNLKQQLKTLSDEKEYALRLWQSATESNDFLEQQLKVYQDNTQGFVPKTEITKIRSKYENKIKTLEDNLTRTNKKLEETINSTSKELSFKNKEITDTHQSQDNTFKIVKNLEDEILKLQERISVHDRIKSQLEDAISRRNNVIDTLKLKNKDCMTKVMEAVRIVEAALNEKDAALIRETQAKDEIVKLSRTLSEAISAAEDKIKSETNATKALYEAKLSKLVEDLNKVKDQLKQKSSDVENHLKEIAFLNREIDRLQKGPMAFDDSTTSKLLVLEKNLENTFQKLLLAEKQNIQISSENTSIRNDLEQMSRYYERDITQRETEKIVLRKEMKTLEIQLEESHKADAQSCQIITELKNNIAELEAKHKKELEETKCALEKDSTKTMAETVTTHNKLINELRTQLEGQIEINRKWRNETKNIAEKLEGKITEMKKELSKMKADNKILNEKLKDANAKIHEYKKFLQVISRDVNKITNIALPDKNELTS